MNDSQRNNAPWTDIIARTPEAFMRAYARGEINTDDISSQARDNGPPGDGASKAVTSTFSFNAGILSATGNNLDNTITFTRDASGAILVNNGEIPVSGGTPTVANTSLIQASGQGGNDTITLNEANGALPRANLYGGAANDVLTSGSGADMVFGQAGSDTLLGKLGNDLLFGGSDNDVLIGGDGDDQMYGESGNDRMVWNPGDDSDLMEGGDGNDTAEVNGGNGNETFTLTANDARVRFDRLNPAPFSLDIGTTENLVLNMNGGDDTFSATGNLAPLISVNVDGGAGNDTILGSNGNDKLAGGDGNDFIDGQQGNDTALLGAGNDVFQWDPGDGSDTVEGGDGMDSMLFNGSAAAEQFEVSANGDRTRLTRNVGTIVMDVNDVEIVNVNALGNTDTMIVNDLSGTDVTEMNINLAATIGGTTGDGQADTTIVNGTSAADVIDVVGAGTSVSVLGLPARVNVSNAEVANDSLVVKGGAGDDAMTATTLPGNIVKLTMDGGAGDDRILGSQGADTLIGGDGNDFVFGDNGDDVALLGAGNDVFQWNPGDGSDTIEGGDGVDTMQFFGANIAENIDISASGDRVRFVRNIAGVTMDLNDVEAIDFRALGGGDNIVVADLSATDVKRVDIDLQGPNGGADGAEDSVTIDATQAADVFGARGDASGVTVFGLPAQVNMAFTDSADRLTLNGQAGDDVIDATLLQAGAVKLAINGGLGADVMFGSKGDDVIAGGDGDDTAFMGDGDDTFVWNPGDDNDTIEGQVGFDTLKFNGANIAENIAISANGERVRFSRDIASVSMDLNDVERVDFSALGGADNVTVTDLSGTDLTRVNVDLAGTLGGTIGDNAVDTVNVKGSSGDDVVLVIGDTAGVGVNGLAAQVNIVHQEAANDRLIVDAGAGDDVIDASGLAFGTMQLTLDGGVGDDVLIAGPGASTLLGGSGDDILIGGAGDDYLDGGPGADIIIGGGGNDTIIAGNLQVQGFQAGAGIDDRIDLRGVSSLTFDWLMAHATMVDGNAVLDLGNGDHMTLVGVDTKSLGMDDFIMGG